MGNRKVRARITYDPTKVTERKLAGAFINQIKKSYFIDRVISVKSKELSPRSNWEKAFPEGEKYSDDDILTNWELVIIFKGVLKKKRGAK